MNIVYNENCLETMKRMPDNSIDAVVTDPPYGISFMNKQWDYDVPSIDIWKEVYRVLKPGGHILCFGGTRTYHRMVCNIEDAGFEIRDQLAWVFGSGFPKSMDISKQLDKMAGAERDVLYTLPAGTGPMKSGHVNKSGGGMSIGTERSPELKVTLPATDEAKQWKGFGTALKPAHEPICLARKPIEGTIAKNVLEWGVGGLNIDGCRIEHDDPEITTNRKYSSGQHSANKNDGRDMEKWELSHSTIGQKSLASANPLGRFPSNFIHDGSDEVLELFPNSKGQQGDLTNRTRLIESLNGIYSKLPPRYDAIARNDEGSAARFFYCAKASKVDRNEGLEDLELTKSIGHNRFDRCQSCGGYILQNPTRPSACKCENPIREDNVVSGNYHPTVKPTSLMRYLCRLITPNGGKIFDPFAGSGSSGKAAILEGFEFVGSELDAEYTIIANARIKYAIDNKDKLIDKHKLEHIENVMPKLSIDHDEYF